MAGNVKISALPDVEQSQVQGTAYFPFSDKFGEPQAYETKKMSLEQAIKALDDVDDLLAYEITTGYPEKPVINMPLEADDNEK